MKQTHRKTKIKTAIERSNSRGIEKVYLSWGEYIKLIKRLTEKIRKSKIKFDYIFGPVRGGYIPSVILAHEFKAEILETHSIVDREWLRQTRHWNLLLIDDIIDTSKTMKMMIPIFPNKKIYTASLFKHKKCKFVPDFYVEENKDWIVFPYEKE